MHSLHFFSNCLPQYMLYCKRLYGYINFFTLNQSTNPMAGGRRQRRTVHYQKHHQCTRAVSSVWSCLRCRNIWNSAYDRIVETHVYIPQCFSWGVLLNNYDNGKPLLSNKTCCRVVIQSIGTIAVTVAMRIRTLPRIYTSRLFILIGQGRPLPVVTL